MIARHDTSADTLDIWAQLSGALDPGTISWRQDGRAVERDGKYFARFVAYVDANTVRERLDGVVPGEWDLTLELLPTLPSDDRDDAGCSFKARLQILGVIREDVGTGRDYKLAATDAFKRAAVRFGIAHELYAYEQNWVQVDSDGKYARPIEEPASAYARRIARSSRSGPPQEPSSQLTDTPQGVDSDDRPVDMSAQATGPLAIDEPTCPKCGGRMWDNRLSKRNPKAPDYKCRSRSCDGVIWPPRPPAGAPANGSGGIRVDPPDSPAAETAAQLDELPF